MSEQKRPIWPLWVLVAWMGIGLAISVLMTWHHDTQAYGTAAVQGELIGCVESATVNCDIVNTSAWSELMGIPIATLSFAAYATVAMMAALAARGRETLRPLLVGAGVIAVLASAFLFYQSKIELGYVCAWCLRLYGVNFGILVFSLLSRPKWTIDNNAIGLAVGLLIGNTVVFGGIERVYRESLLGDAPAGLVAVGNLAGESMEPAPALTYTVATEDGKTATFTLDPDDAWRGPLDAKVAVVEFADLECGFCKRTNSELERLYAAYGDRVLFVFKHFPMNPDCNDGVKNKKHRDACDAAIAATCARQQGKFWDFENLTFKNQHQLGDEYLKTYAAAVGADPVKFAACQADPKTLASVKADAKVGASLDIHGTPRIFINGKLYRSGSSAEAMAKEIEAAIGMAGGSKAASLREKPTAVDPIPADIAAMQSVDVGGLKFQIDTFEATIVDGKAVSAKHQIPALRTSWFEAKAACEASGKRLCSEEEWVTACQNARAVDENHNGEFADDMIEGTAWPYGDFHEDGRCWDAHDEGNAKDGSSWRPVYTGEMPGCATPTHVYDMTGNVEEWVGTSPDNAALIGGAWDTKEDHAKCYRRNDTFGAGYASPRTGFRCCSN